MMNVFLPALLILSVVASTAHVLSAEPAVLSADKLERYCETFRKSDNEVYVQHVANAMAPIFLKKNAPLFECPDKDLEEIYYFRWWTYRKHIKQTPDGFVITEFLPKVGWSGKHNAINCAAGHHFYEGRWLHDQTFLDDYSMFWFRKGGNPRQYSCWIADAIWARTMVTGNVVRAMELLPDLIANYEAWEQKQQHPSGLFWQTDNNDGMEMSIGGAGCRATINSYMYGDAVAIAKIAGLLGKEKAAEAFRKRAATLKSMTQEKLWDADAKFFKVLRLGKDGKPQGFSDGRELHGFTPWYMNLPDADKTAAWSQLMDPEGFCAPFGPTTAEQRHPRFSTKPGRHECTWNGPSWPYATSVTLTALANLLNNYEQDVIEKKDYLQTLRIYAMSHRLKYDDGTIVPWIDENLDPETGEWIARKILRYRQNNTTWSMAKGGFERGKDYNHSTFCDLIITGLVGLRPQDDGSLVVNPLVPDGVWDWFCLDNVLYRGRVLTILYDKTGQRYGKGTGLRVLMDGKEVGQSDNIGPVKVAKQIVEL
jgi:hypothetical protein